MKTRVISLLMALCLMLTLAPAAFAADTSGLQGLIDTADAGSTINLSADYTITDTVTIDKGITINGNGHTITYDGSNSAVAITAQAAVKLQGLTINATNNNAYAVDLTSSQPNLTVDNCVINVGNRGINMYPVGGCTNGSLVIDNTTIQNSRVSGDYADNTTIGDTRGIALYNVENSDIDITDSHIYGFGYSINTSADEEDDGTRLASNRFDITGTDIWGWSAVNVWTVGNTFNITNCDLRGINPSNTLGNSFSVLVINKGIYGSSPDSAAPNVFNIYGGTLDAKMTVSTSFVEETIAYLGNQYTTEFHFYRRSLKKVVMTCDKPFSAIIAEALNSSGEEDPAFRPWALSDKLTGPENASYNQGSTSTWFPNMGLIAPGVYAGKTKSTTSLLSDDGILASSETTYHIGGATS